MKKNSKASVALHALIHLIKNDKPLTSKELGECLHTNPVVIRRILGELKKAEIVTSEKGHGGGWVVVKNAVDITFYDVLTSLGEHLLPTPLALAEDECCLVMKTVASTMDDFLEEAKALLDIKLKRISLEEIVQKI